MGTDGLTEKVVLEAGVGLMVGESREIPETDWSIRLERVVEDRPTFRIEPTAS